MRRLIGFAMAAGAVLSGTPVAAQDSAPPIKYFAPGGIFVWADGAYHNIKLPAYGLGFFEVSTTTFEKLRAVQTYDPRTTGGGASGGVGFFLPHGMLPGANSRVALNGSFVTANATQTASSPSVGNAVQLLNGFLVAPCGDCQIPSRLQTDHRSWRVGLNATSEFSAGPVTLSPLGEVFGGGSQTHQVYAQRRIVVGGPTAFYDADTTMRWHDVGAKAGVAASIPITSIIGFGIVGTVAAVHRNASLAGNDRLDDGFGIISTSAVSFSRSAVAIVSGAEAQITIRPRATIQMKAFGGVEYDNRVPGIVAPSFTPDQFALIIPDGTQATPASIGFSAQTSYRLGGGVTVAFPP